MDKLEQVTQKVMARLGNPITTDKPENIKNSSDKDDATKPQPSRSASSKPTCPLCNDVGWLAGEMVMDRLGHMVSSAVRCSCMADADKQRRTAFLLKMDGLTSVERTRRFGNIRDTYGPGTLHGVKLAVEQHRGLITLNGNYGTGKSTLLICAVNEARENGRLAIYTTLADLLSYLRSTFAPDAEETFDKYWDALVKCDVLALDELDEFATTPWAMEKFLMLMDERWRRMEEVLTLCALNNRLQSLPGKVQSRLRDGRAQLITTSGPDLRALNSWEGK